MADLGNLYFGFHLKDLSDKELDAIMRKIQNRLESNKVKLGIDFDPKSVSAFMEKVNKARTQAMNLTRYDGADYKRSMNQMRDFYRQQEAEASRNESNAKRRAREIAKISSESARLDREINKLSINRQYGVLRGAKVDDAVKLLESHKQKLENALNTGDRKNVLEDISKGQYQRAINQARQYASEQRLINKQHDYSARKISEIQRRQKELNRLMGEQGRLSGQLKSQLLDLYSIYTLEQFGMSVIKIGGEFQKQHIALKAMLGDAAKADTMYAKIKNLAIDSPFNFRELMGFTKQNAAFGIPYEELYDTTKRLADISAGLGVDMGRIILAYGQVRSAAFLRGQELRQFTEAGIPLVDELAKKFSELEGRVVSAGEVFEKISSREVSFDMVKDVLWQLTDEGGKFYNMQEVLTSSLAGKLAKLTDAYEIMLSEIAEGNNGVLGTALDFATALTERWRGLSVAIVSVLAGMATYRALLIGYTAFKKVQLALDILEGRVVIPQVVLARVNEMRAMRGLNAVTMKQLMTQRALNAVLGKHPYIMIAAAVVALGAAIWNAVRNANELNNALSKIGNEESASLQNSVDNYKLLVEKLKDATKGSKEYYDTLSKIRSQYGSYIGEISNEADAYGYLYSKINDVTEALRAKHRESARQRMMSEIDNNFTDDLNSDMQDFIESIKTDFLGVSDVQAREIASIYRKRIQKAIKEGLDPKAIDIESIMKELGLNKIEKIDYKKHNFNGKVLTPKELTYKSNTDAAKDLISTLTDYNEKSKEVDSNLDAMFGNYESWNIKVDNIRKEAEELEKKMGKMSPEQKRDFDINTIDKAIKAISDIPCAGDKVKELEREREALSAYKADWVKTIKEVKNKTAELTGINESVLEIIMPGDKQIEGKQILQWLESLAAKANEAKEGLKKIESMKAPEFTREFAASKEKYKAYLKFVELLKEMTGIDVFAFSKTKGGGGEDRKDTFLEGIKERIRLYREAYAEYKKLAETLGQDEAMRRLKQSGLFSVLGEDGIPKSREDLKQKVLNAQKELKKAIRNAPSSSRRDALRETYKLLFEFDYDIDKDKLEKRIKEVQEFISEQSDKYDLFKSVFDKTGNMGLSLQLAYGDISVGENKLMENLRDNMMPDLQRMGITIEEALNKPQDWFEDKGEKALWEFVKAYKDAQNELRKSTAETIADIIEQNRSLKDKYKEIDRKADEKKDYFRKNRAGLEQKGIDVDGAIRSIDVKAEFEKFKISPDWAKIFGDLDNLSSGTISGLIGKLETFAYDMGLGADETKEVIEALRKLREEYIERSPWKAIGDSLTRFKNAKEINRRMDVAGTDSYTFTKDELGYKKGNTITREQNNDNLKAEKSTVKKSVNELVNCFEMVSNAVSHFSDLLDAVNLGGLADAFDVLGSGLSGAKAGGDMVTGTLKMFGASEKITKMLGPYGAAAGAAIGLIQGVVDKHNQAIQEDIDALNRHIDGLNKAYDLLNGIVEGGVGSLDNILAAYELTKKQSERMGHKLDKGFTVAMESLKDNGEGYLKGLEERIRGSEEQIKHYREMQVADPNMYHSYESAIRNLELKLEIDKESLKQLEKAGVGKNIENDALKAARAQYISLVEQQRMMQEKLDKENQKSGKKNKDEIKDIQNELKEVNNQIANFAEELAKTMFGIDIDAWGEQISDALVTAFQNGEDAAVAFENVTNDIMRSVAKGMLRSLVVEPMLNDLKEKLFGKDGKSGLIGGDITSLEGKKDDLVKILTDYFNTTGKEYVNASQIFLDTFDKVSSGALSATEEDMPSLGASEKSLTEETANILASYINAVRADVSMQRFMQEKFFNVDFPKMSAIAQAQLAQLNIIAENTGRNARFAEDIFNLLSRNTVPGTGFRIA